MEARECALFFDQHTRTHMCTRLQRHALIRAQKKHVSLLPYANSSFQSMKHTEKEGGSRWESQMESCLGLLSSGKVLTSKHSSYASCRVTVTSTWTSDRHIHISRHTWSCREHEPTLSPLQMSCCPRSLANVLP